jgi:hypothetical protein
MLKEEYSYTHNPFRAFWPVVELNLTSLLPLPAIICDVFVDVWKINKHKEGREIKQKSDTNSMM